VRTVRASTYDDYFGGTIFAIGSKMYEEIGLVRGTQQPIHMLLLHVTRTVATTTPPALYAYRAFPQTDNKGVCSNLVAYRLILTLNQLFQ